MQVRGGKTQMSESFVAAAARRDEERIAADDGLARGFSGFRAEGALPKDGLGFLEIPSDEELHLVAGGGEIDNRHLAAEAMEDVIASDDDTAARVEDKVAVRIVLEIREGFIKDGDLCGEVFGFTVSVGRAVRPTHPSCNTLDACVAARSEDRSQAGFDLIIARDRGTADGSEIFCPVRFPGAGHTDQSEA
jgi:hypothetical protein